MTSKQVATPVSRAVDLDRSLTIEAIIFDMDGLLIDSEPLTDEALEALLAAHDCHIAWTLEQTTSLMGRRMPEILEVIAGICGITTPAAELNEALEAKRIEVMRDRLQAMPGAGKLVGLARSSGLRLALATSGRRSYADAALREVGLAGSFAVEVTGEGVSRGKPDPEIYLLAAQRLNVDPSRCVVFEDAPAGIAAAVAAGMIAVAVPNTYTRDLPFDPAPHAVLPDLHAAITWLEERRTRPL